MRYYSVFSGVEAASLAFRPLGWEPLAFSEIDPFPCAVLKERFPMVPNLGDMTEIDWKEAVREFGRPDLVVGGSPCQSFSIAGKREGLGGQSGLMYEFVRCVREVRPRWFLWENVPGALSVERGAAFGQLLSEMADGGGYGLSWRVLDAVFFGVPQRRRRLFLVGRAGNGYRAACQVLFEPEGLRGDTATSAEKRQELAARAERGPRAAGFLPSNGGKARGLGLEEETSPTLKTDHNPAVYAVRTAQTGANGVGVSDVAHTVDTTGPEAVMVAGNQRGEVRLDGGDGQTVGAIPANPSGKQFQAVLTPWDVQSKRVYSEHGTTGALQSGTHEGRNIQPIVMTGTQGHSMASGDFCGTLTGPHTTRDTPVTNVPTVRRLTPRECERLQGMPDDWTLVDYKGGPAKDGPRYKAIGNSMAVPVMRWIGERMETVDAVDH